MEEKGSNSRITANNSNNFASLDRIYEPILN